MQSKKCPFCAEEIQLEAVKCKHCNSWLDSAPPRGVAGGSFGSFASKRLRRSSSDRMVFGVCGGLGHMFDIDPTVIRALYALLTVFTVVIPCLILYLIMAVIIPPEPD